TLYFIYMYEHKLRKSVSDGILSVKEAIAIFISTAPIFFFALIITDQIHMLYLESLNLIEWQFTPGQGFFSFLGVHWEDNPELFTEAMFDSNGNLHAVGRNSYGAWIMIYATPFFNVMSVVFITSEVMKNNKLKWSSVKKDDKKDPKQTDPKDKDKDKNTDPKEKYTKNESEVFNRLSKILGTLSGSNLYNNYKSLCGIESHNGVAKHAQVKDDASLKEFQKNTMNVLLGDPKPEDPSGITGYDYAESTIKKLREDAEYKSILRGINEAEAKLTNESDPVKKRGIETEKKSWEDKQREYENKHKLSKLDKALPKIKEDLSKYCKAIGLIQ
ncbi:MAG TPA: hypothetical protein PLW93_05215, partial [Candidatus Absconditabacterales bacterium]|nr:hypothetical protein [Candidatus Absconditabacterales bacterium]